MVFPINITAVLLLTTQLINILSTRVHYLQSIKVHCRFAKTESTVGHLNLKSNINLYIMKINIIRKTSAAKISTIHLYDHIVEPVIL
jgi:hypothetical protein